MAETAARVPLIAGNWKMNLDHREAVTLVQRLAWLLTDADHDHEDVEVAVFPPFTDLRAVQVLVTGDRLDVAYGAQDLSPEDSGAYTGDVSGAFLAALGCRYAIVGHSERRTIHGEDDALVARKAAAALRHGLSPVVCVGEGLDVRQAGRHVAHTVAQLEGSLVGLSAEDVARTVVAYEPCGRSAPARSPAPGTPRRCAPPCGPAWASCTATTSPPGCGSCTAAP